MQDQEDPLRGTGFLIAIAFSIVFWGIVIALSTRGKS